MRPGPIGVSKKVRAGTPERVSRHGLVHSLGAREPSADARITNARAWREVVLRNADQPDSDTGPDSDPNPSPDSGARA